MKYDKAANIAKKLNKLYDGKILFQPVYQHSNGVARLQDECNIKAMSHVNTTYVEFILDLRENPSYNQVLSVIPHALAETTLKCVEATIKTLFGSCP